MTNPTNTRKVALLVELDIPAEAWPDSALLGVVEALRAATPVQPTNVTAYVDDAARRVLDRGEL